MWHGGWGWGWGWSWMWGFGWIFLLFLIFGVSRLFWWRRYPRGGYGYGWHHHGPWGEPDGGAHHAEAILRERLARGEIDVEEFERLKEALRR